MLAQDHKMSLRNDDSVKMLGILSKSWDFFGGSSHLLPCKKSEKYENWENTRVIYETLMVRRTRAVHKSPGRRPAYLQE